MGGTEHAAPKMSAAKMEHLPKSEGVTLVTSQHKYITHNGVPTQEPHWRCPAPRICTVNWKQYWLLTQDDDRGERVTSIHKIFKVHDYF